MSGNLNYVGVSPIASTLNTTRLIDIGPFFDRFGAAKLAVLSSTDVTIQAILRDIQVRKWIDLDRPDVASTIDYIMTKVPAVTPDIKAYILNTPVSSDENIALIKLYG